jgi:hypothetical protein
MTEEVGRVAHAMGWAEIGERRLRARQSQDGRMWEGGWAAVGTILDHSAKGFLSDTDFSGAGIFVTDVVGLGCVGTGCTNSGDRMLGAHCGG